MPSHTIDSLAAVMERIERDLRDHRDEASQASERTTQKLDEIRDELVGTRETAKSVGKLEKTVYGEGDTPGIKGRLETVQGKVAGLLWFGALVVAAVVALAFEWIGRSLHGGKQ